MDATMAVEPTELEGLQAAKHLFYQRFGHLDSAILNELWNDRMQLVNSANSHRSLSTNNIPTDGNASIAPHYSSFTRDAHSLNRSHGLSQQSAPPMVRNGSYVSSHHEHPSPFGQNNNESNSFSGTHVNSLWNNNPSPDFAIPQPSTSNMFTTQSTRIEPAQVFTPEDWVSLNANMDDVITSIDSTSPTQEEPTNNWFMSTATSAEPMMDMGLPPPVFLTPSPTQPPVRQRRLDGSRLSLSYPQAHPFAQSFEPSPPTPDLTASSSAMQSEDSMSSFGQGVGMMRLSSQPGSSSAYGSAQSFAQSTLLTGVGSFAPPSHGAFQPLQEESPTTMDLTGGQDMLRTISTESTTSVASNASSRSLGRLQASIESGQKTSIKPKGTPPKAGVIAEKMTAHKKKSLTTKSRYHRPDKPPRPCPHCPKTFRGEHELRRHILGQHSDEREVWICVDGSAEAAMDNSVLPKIPLRNCKPCRENKEYGIYYNAASHLRRKHFHPNERSAPAAKKVVSQKVGRKKKAECRAGQAGGDDPQIPILKQYWMKPLMAVKGEMDCDKSTTFPDANEVPDGSDEEDQHDDHDEDGSSSIGIGDLDQTASVSTIRAASPPFGDSDIANLWANETDGEQFFFDDMTTFQSADTPAFLTSV